MLLVAVVGSISYFAINYFLALNTTIQEKFDGKKWQLPAIAYSRSLDLYPMKKIDPNLLEKELQLADYRKETPVTAPGGYFRDQDFFGIYTRGFHFASGYEDPVAIYLTIEDGVIINIRSGTTEKDIDFVRLDPARIGSFHPKVHEDRLVLGSKEIPDLLREGLIAVEDKNFAIHHGVAPLAILRAAIANFQSGRTVQGGSTLTQQLVKNLYLDRERSIKRKVNEAAMALLLDYHYSKEEILTTYINEVFLGQDGARAIHGFGLAAQFYFQKELGDLSVAQIATLIGMVKGASLYDPRKYPERCTERRDVVLNIMQEDGVITTKDYQVAIGEKLITETKRKSGFNRFPAYLDLVRQQLSSEYREEDLQTNGLQILTNLDPQIQWILEEQLQETLSGLEEKNGTESLEGAGVITSRETGEVFGLAGGREFSNGEFNRALHAVRPIGSLVKPAVFLTGLAEGYTLATPLLDSKDGLQAYSSDWQPRNYDRKEHGFVPLYYALAKSYNLATVHLGFTVGLEKVIETIEKLGYPNKIAPYPSLLLGAIEMSPIQVSQLYQTIGSGGFYQPLRSIQSVMTSEGKLVTRYGLEVEQRFSPVLMELLTHALNRVVREGTAQSYRFSPDKFYAGKTGTSDGLRDSWFAGFSRDHTAVVWLGRDDNKSTPYTGSSGALQVWGNVMEALGGAPGPQVTSPDLVWRTIELQQLFGEDYQGPASTALPFLKGTEPNPEVDNTPPFRNGIEDEARKIFESIKTFFQ